MNRFVWYVSALSLTALAGCADADAPSVATRQEAIVGGKISSPNDDAVVGVFGSGSGCTGTLIAPNVVLTALHCVAGFDSRFTFSCRSDGTLAPGATTGRLGAPIAPEGVSVGFGVNLGQERIYAKAIYSTGSEDVCHDDLALIVLESAPAIGDVPLVSLRFARPTRKGESTRAVGYGDVEMTQSEVGRQERKHITVRGVGGIDAKHPVDSGIAPRTLQVGEGPCHGDSGGPLFSEETGAEIGVYSLLQTSTCTGLDVRNTYTLVAPFEPLIRMVLEAEGAEALVEPSEPSASGGGAGAGSIPVGGSSGSGGSEPPLGEAAAPSGPDEGSGSYQDSSCGLRAAGGHAGAPWLPGAALGLALWAARRARARKGARS